jgi:TPR repeat protein
MLKNGMAALEQGHIAPARGFFERVYWKGLAAGAFMMAVTFDPDEMKHPSVVGLDPDPDQARVWYERARDLGHPDADRRLQRLGRQARR